jgi:hypothetical protein
MAHAVRRDFLRALTAPAAVLRVWRSHATDVRGQALPGRHFLPEKAPEQRLAGLLAFL